MNLIKLFSFVGLFFSPIAAIMAFIISYEEYIRHYTNKKEPIKLALSAVIVIREIRNIVGRSFEKFKFLKRV